MSVNKDEEYQPMCEMCKEKKAIGWLYLALGLKAAFGIQKRTFVCIDCCPIRVQPGRKCRGNRKYPTSYLRD